MIGRESVHVENRIYSHTENFQILVIKLPVQQPFHVQGVGHRMWNHILKGGRRKGHQAGHLNHHMALEQDWDLTSIHLTSIIYRSTIAGSSKNNYKNKNLWKHKTTCILLNF